MNQEPEDKITESQEKPKDTPPTPGEERFIGDIIDNKRHGTLERYDENANLKARHSLEKGILHGETHRYDAANRLEEKITYHEGVPHGPAEFYKESVPFLTTHFHEGKQQGEVILYD